ncbi:SAM-dependent methyltransferase [Actinoplanes campanulatus]|uniref:SAM-dependent methyltransferase n=1 Tax=Actinoplanes campanulatus TaxID=113559 RepID=A0A7W5FJU3_9ACTN|nr:class I SAM-dependent methyltransferase [Actinoplanes campanulatus]MBB3101021.1 SAM-dependent methyltransferase [Actinoplanes campanulatus]GGN49260.1 methyltransferase type 12 [Actinoplanes campanulatus]GID41889.1 methyltransferase type 12 [Actinoplanes campanulatus]
MNAVAVFDAAINRAAAGIPAAFTARHESGNVLRFDPGAWCQDVIAGDVALLDRCTGPTLDVGCGPGRLTGALARSGRPALGIDISATAVRLARRRGATALRRDVFDPVPGTGRWRHLLLADGNIGIGGNPRRLLRRCRELLEPDGRLHAELAPPGTPAWSGIATVQTPAGQGGPLPWACVPADGLTALASAAALRILDTRTEAGRWFATLAPQ